MSLEKSRGRVSWLTSGTKPLHIGCWMFAKYTPKPWPVCRGKLRIDAETCLPLADLRVSYADAMQHTASEKMCRDWLGPSS